MKNLYLCIVVCSAIFISACSAQPSQKELIGDFTAYQNSVFGRFVGFQYTENIENYHTKNTNGDFLVFTEIRTSTPIGRVIPVIKGSQFLIENDMISIEVHNTPSAILMYTAKVDNIKITYTVGNVNIGGKCANTVFLDYKNLFEGMLISDGKIRINDKYIEIVLSSGAQSIFRVNPDCYESNDVRIFEGISRGIVAGEVTVLSPTAEDIVRYGDTKIKLSQEHENGKIVIATVNAKEKVLIVNINSHMLSSWDKISVYVGSHKIRFVHDFDDVFYPKNKNEPVYTMNICQDKTQFIIYLSQDTLLTIEKGTLNILLSSVAGILLTFICGIVMFRRKS